jgi:PHD/YefM family antitoxin component YafN of YafNO toxin-antitoxin module
LIPNPIRKVLSSIERRRVRALLMGGQACILYGAAEFSRDTDLAVLASPRNLARLKRALDDLEAETIAVPPFEARFLRRGHAVHFRCHHPDAAGMRVDVMTRMRGVAPFSRLWARRRSIELSDGSTCHVLSLPDLVRAKKTQRDKDWPMLRRLLEADYFGSGSEPSRQQVLFWLRELRTPALLAEVARRWPKASAQAARRRPLLRMASAGKERRLEAALAVEEQRERRADARYWAPLKAELERLRLARARAARRPIRRAL